MPPTRYLASHTPFITFPPVSDRTLLIIFAQTHFLLWYCLGNSRSLIWREQSAVRSRIVRYPQLAEPCTYTYTICIGVFPATVLTVDDHRSEVKLIERIIWWNSTTVGLCL